MQTQDEFVAHRSKLLSLAYRMLGSKAEAEDVLQEAWLRWSTVDPSTVESSEGWLTTVVSRLCMDQLKSARARREQYVGPWLPEPVLTREPVDSGAISLAFLVLLESLGPVERAAYLLHEVFDYRHSEIARILDKDEAAVRQLVHRARARVQEGRPRFAPSREEHQRMLEAFFQAVWKGDVEAVEAALTKDATLWADSNGKVRGAASKPVHGAAAIARFLVGLRQKFPAPTGLTVGTEEVNGWPAIVGRVGGTAEFVITIETDGAQIHALRNVVNPEKLRLQSLE
ncbi:sigma-70 family RNA polymerase sigma factor [Aggregicoccus sp. 17bor-14]|uniref:RNA polymerase sigma factor SigJ n=1 Tax=Myxococcaceae TaxID=31 RepID=UPI00129CCA33|nr:MULTISPECIES: RNA polymerase sigma factor SigJ [Myxococcaceae]MBF5042164.1 RNA polymerase sigma factor SigJ [Simulacricoccus sp. 17bor-14]MRI87941.1 sigma-70 family RNA polymerase sigma factor [Aggregicoccus sp. 17bor-14]